MRLAHNPMLMASRGIEELELMILLKPKHQDPTGHYIITGRETGRTRL